MKTYDSEGRLKIVTAAGATGITELTGDVTAGPGSGSQVATIANDAVTFPKFQPAAGFDIVAKATTGAGDYASLVAADETVLGRTGGGNLTFAQLATGQIADLAVTLAKIQDIGPFTLLGHTAGLGSPQQITPTDGIEFDGGLGLRIANDGVTFAKMQNIATDSLIGRDTAGTGDPESITLGASLEFSGSQTIQRAALTGDVTAAANSNATIIANDVVTFAKMQNISTDRLLGRDTAATGDVEEISLNATLEFTGAQAIQRAALTGDVTASAGSNATVLSSTLKVVAISFIIDGGGSAITTGQKGHLEIPFACTINRVTLMADQTGSVVVDIWKDTFANFPPTNADSITAAAKPTLSGAQSFQDSTLTGWTTSIAAGDILAYNIDSVATITRLTVSLKATRT